MCGLAGAFSLKDDGRLGPDAGERVAGMITAIRHRGPDDAGVWVGDRVALGHARLSIIDLTAAGHQPMTLDGSGLQIVFNGEIYNFQALRAELEGRGCRFQSNTDTEVILHGYREWGEGVFARLRGMFAIALWDGGREALLLARDRVGKKPLFHATCNGTLLFGSEIKALLAWPGMQRVPDLQAIHHYLTLQYVPAPWSAFQGVHKVRQGTVMVFERGRATPRTVQYWSLPAPAATTGQTFEALVDEVVPRLTEAVRLRMVADVPLGAFLSGGVDSSAIVALMAGLSPGPVKTFCIGFDEAEFDEREYAREVAVRYATDHHEMVVRPNAIDVLPAITWHYNEPYADPSAIPTWYVSEIARRHVTVALNGDGGDEGFLGYSRYRQCYAAQQPDRVPPVLLRALGRFAQQLPHALDRYRVVRALRRLLPADQLDASTYAPSMAYFYEHDKQEGYDERLRPHLPDSTLGLLQPWFDRAPSYLAGAAWADIQTYLPDDLLVKVDIASMAHGLEARSPLLDHELMEWTAGIPAGLKMRGGETKAILKKAMEPYLPVDVLYRPKMGFGVPIDRWLRSELRDFAHDLLLDGTARGRGLVRTAFVERLLREHCDGVRLHHTRLWALLMLECWYRMWIDPPAVPLTRPQAALDAAVA